MKRRLEPGRREMNGTASYFRTETNRWNAIVQRLSTADAHFRYGVKTTGIYCRPSCAARKPRRENVVFFEDAAVAEAAGFRPCKRCRPNLMMPQQPRLAMIAAACRQIEQAEAPPSLSDLAAAAGLSPSHFQRVFKATMGITPKQYAIAHRAQQVRHHLHTQPTVTEAIYAAGFETASQFYEQSLVTLGMQPAHYRKGADGMAIQYTVKPCWLGWVLIAGTAKGICAIALDDAPEPLVAQLRKRFPKANLQTGDRTFEIWVTQVLEHLDAPHQPIDVPLDLRGTAFQHQVWTLLRTIPPGETQSYGEIAKQLGNPKATRAVAQACGANPVAVVVPCHRVVGRDGQLRGYRWGCDRKQALLQREANPHPPNPF